MSHKQSSAFGIPNPDPEFRILQTKSRCRIPNFSNSNSNTDPGFKIFQTQSQILIPNFPNPIPMPNPDFFKLNLVSRCWIPNFPNLIPNLDFFKRNPDPESQSQIPKFLIQNLLLGLVRRLRLPASYAERLVHSEPGLLIVSLKYLLYFFWDISAPSR